MPLRSVEKLTATAAAAASTNAPRLKLPKQRARNVATAITGRLVWHRFRKAARACSGVIRLDASSRSTYIDSPKSANATVTNAVPCKAANSPKPRTPRSLAPMRAENTNAVLVVAWLKVAHTAPERSCPLSGGASRERRVSPVEASITGYWMECIEQRVPRPGRARRHPGSTMRQRLTWLTRPSSRPLAGPAQRRQSQLHF